MKQEDKELLLRDLCARLPYGVKVLYENDVFNIDYISSMYEEVHLDIVDNYTIGVSDVKTYLFPLSSMTPKQKAELSMIVVGEEDLFKAFLIEVEFYHKHHIDYRGLIPKGLAIDASRLNIY